jgi:hypothetical protein
VLPRPASGKDNRDGAVVHLAAMRCFVKAHHESPNVPNASNTDCQRKGND